MTGGTPNLLESSIQQPLYPFLLPAANPMTDGKDVETSIHVLAQQTEEIKTREAALLSSLKKCEEQKGHIKAEFENLQRKVDELNPKAKVLVKEESYPTALEVLQATGRVAKEHWKAALLAGVLAAGVVWIYKHFKLPTFQIEGHSRGNHYTSYDIKITPKW